MVVNLYSKAVALVVAVNSFHISTVLACATGLW